MHLGVNNPIARIHGTFRIYLLVPRIRDINVEYKELNEQVTTANGESNG